MIIRDREHRIAAVRRFNRFYTRQLGVLRKTYLGSPYSLGEARVLYEIASGDAPTASDIGRALDLDAGYLSRTLRNFEKRGLIARKASAKRRPAKPSGAVAARPKGFRAAGAALAAGYRGDARQAFSRGPGAADRGDEHDRKAARRRAGTRFDARAAIYLARARTGDFGWIVKRHAELYAQEYGWAAPFEGVCAQIVADFVNNYDAKRERCWIAEMDGENVGSIMLAKENESVARIRLSAGRPESARARARRAAHRRMHPLRAARRLQEDHAMDRTACSPRRATSTRKPASS